MKKCIFLIVCFYIFSCNNSGTRDSNLDEFYTDQGGFDMARIPLIKPYEAVVPSTGKVDWLVHSTTDSVLFTIPGVKETAVLNKHLILIHGVNTSINYMSVKEGWFVLIPSKNFIRAFSKYEDYLNWLHSQGFEKAPNLYNPANIYRFFKSYGIVDWKKIENDK